MSKFFNPENAFFTTINKIVDTIWLSLLWTICSLPLFTIGPASCGLYYATVKVTRRNRSYVTKEFFKGFKQNFKVGAPATVIFLVLSWVLWIDYQYANALMETSSTMGNVYFIVFVTGAVIEAFLAVWMFPILSRFTVGLKQLFKSTLAISAKHLVRTILLVIIAVFWALFVKVAFSTIELVSFVVFIPFAAPGVTALLRSFIIEPVLKKYQGESAGDPEETGIDEWYRE